jgi:hypothetical protein
MINAPSMATYGFRPMVIDSPWVTPFPQGSTDLGGGIALAVTLANYVYSTQGFNEKLRSGSLTCHGLETIKQGAYLLIPEENLQFYTESFTEEFQFVGAQSPTWATQIGISRGIVVSQ